jgi:hypothetical protein
MHELVMAPLSFSPKSVFKVVEKRLKKHPHQRQH